MRGPLWRGWFWTPRARVSMTLRRAAMWYQSWSQRERRLEAARLAAPARWWHRPWWWLALAIGAGVIALAWVLTQFILPLSNVILGHKRVEPLRPFRWLTESVCGRTDPGQCEKIEGFLSSLLGLALAFVLFYIFTRLRVYPLYQRIAREAPEQLVTTSNDVLADVVGRDELCEVLIERIRDPTVRCPMVLVGGVGTGKSAVLVRLTHELAKRSIVPIVLRLRDVDGSKGLDFEKEARQHFIEFIDPYLYSGGQGDRLWRELRWSNKIAVLADGLEELSGPGRHGQEGQHDSILRDAFTKAAHNRLPLIAATRPYDPLRSMPAVIVGLEPLSEGHALAFGLGGDSQIPGSAILARLISDADATESPLYLKVIRDLNRYGRLPEGLEKRPGPGATNRPVDRLAVRWGLLDAWRQALEEGYVCEDFAHDRKERRHALDVVSAFACVGLLKNSLSVTYDDLIDSGKWEREDHEHYVIFKVLRDRVQAGLDVTSRADLVTAVTTAGEFSVVGLGPQGLRFQHGVIQAYLAEQFLTAPELREKPFQQLIRDEPSKESLIALLLATCEHGWTG